MASPKFCPHFRFYYFPVSRVWKAAMMISATQIETIPLRSKKWSETTSEYFPQSVNNMKRNKEAREVKVFQWKYYFVFSPIKNHIFSAILVILYIDVICFLCSWHVYMFLDYFNCSVLMAMWTNNSGTFSILSGQVITKQNNFRTKPIRKLWT